MAGNGENRIGDLPEEIVSLLLSLTSPRDVCRSAVVSPAFRAAAISDAVWERFLPPEYGIIVTASSLSFSCKRELYFRFCGSVLIDGGRKLIALERATSKTCITLSARDLGITWGGNPEYWRWISIPQSRFAESAELVNVCWLEIWGRISGRQLSPKTTYAAFFVFRLSEHSYGLGHPQQEVYVKTGTTVSSSEICLDPTAPERRSTRSRWTAEAPAAESNIPSRARSDGWTEVLMGEFFNDGEEEIEVCLSETKGGNWKRGLIVHGIELRPKEEEF